MKGYQVKVTRLDTGESWPTIVAASEGLYVSIPCLTRAKRKRKSEVLGIPIRFEETDGVHTAVRVQRMDTGEIFKSMMAASRATGISLGAIQRSVRKGYKAHGILWRSV